MENENNRLDIKEREKAKKLVAEILDCSNCFPRIDLEDINEFFQDGKGLRVIEVSVNPALEYRTEVLISDIKEKAKQLEPFNDALIFFLMPDNAPLTMDELLPLSEWFEDFPKDSSIRWGMGVMPETSAYSLRAIVFLQQRKNS